MAARTWKSSGRTLVALVAIASGLVVSTATQAVATPTSCSPTGPGCPAAANDLYTVGFNKRLVVSATAPNALMSNDFGPDGTILDRENSDTSSVWGNATIVYTASGGFTYIPDPTTPFSGTDEFDYQIVDPLSGLFESATAFVTVLTSIKDDTYTVLRNHTLSVGAPGLFANDLGGDPSTLNADIASSHGGAVNVNLNGSFTYTPPTARFTGTDTFGYTVSDLNGDADHGATVHINVVPPPPPPPPPAPKPKGYWMVGSKGTVYAFGQVTNHGNASAASITHLEPTPSKHGYWLTSASGQVFAFGDAKSLGGVSTLKPGEILSSLAATATGKGYWLFTNRGRVVSRGDAKFLGDVHNAVLNGPIVGSAVTPTGKGYYMVGSDGGIFAFGDAKFHGSMGGSHLNMPVNGIVPTANNGGYWLVASDGGIFAFGNAGFHGSMGGAHLNRPVIGMVRYGNGYLMVASDGGIFAFSNLPFLGSLGSSPPAAPIVGVAPGG